MVKGKAIASAFWHLFAERKPTIHDYLAERIGAAELKEFRVSSKELPAFRFPDLYSAADWLYSEQDQIAEIQSDHENADLSTLLHNQKSRYVQREIKRSPMLGWAVDVDEERYLPTDQFWVIGRAGAIFILRLSFNQYKALALLEIASPDSAAAILMLQTIQERSVSHSVYRGKVLELAFVTGTKDEYGTQRRPDISACSSSVLSRSRMRISSSMTMYARS